jgi:hypothetical protein
MAIAFCKTAPVAGAKDGESHRVSIGHAFFAVIWLPGIRLGFRTFHSIGAINYAKNFRVGPSADA